MDILNNIKYILNGGNISTECVQIPLEILYYATDMVQNRDIISKFSDNKLRNYPFSSIWYHKLYLPYIKGIKVFKPLNFISYNKEEVISFLQAEYEWVPYPQKHFESRFTKFFEGHWLPSRFDFDMRRVQFSSLILTGQMSRDDALKKLELPAITPTSVEADYEFIADKLEISVDELASYHNLPLKFFYDYKNQKKVFDIGEFVLQRFMGIRRGGSA